ncbi:1358_t:CDS:2 [Funneliformis mosseae]|uniref:1358_t:CDS:1 n=1 Tax=Funneliformis mosseae TaxID=27381 RepID=A0A9N9F2L4_FUNMO|nr:1358_t:CDS:2 [Funneliformis mosseae]
MDGWLWDSTLFEIKKLEGLIAHVDIGRNLHKTVCTLSIHSPVEMTNIIGQLDMAEEGYYFPMTPSNPKM